MATGEESGHDGAGGTGCPVPAVIVTERTMELLTPSAPRPYAGGSDSRTVVVAFWYGYDTTLAA